MSVFVEHNSGDAIMCIDYFYFQTILRWWVFFSDSLYIHIKRDTEAICKYLAEYALSVKLGQCYILIYYYINVQGRLLRNILYSAKLGLWHGLSKYCFASCVDLFLNVRYLFNIIFQLFYHNNIKIKSRFELIF